MRDFLWRWKSSVGLIFALSCVVSGASHAQAPAPAAKAQAVHTLEQLKAGVEAIRIKNGTPALGIALVNKDGPYWVAGLGEARPESKLKADENTLFRMASASKLFVGLAVMKLVEEGKLNLNDPVRKLAPEITYQNPWEEQHPVLLAHLLEHTSGWDDMHPAEFAWNKADDMPIKDALAYHPHSRTSRWIPGTRMAYCSTGTVVAAYIVEKISGQKFEDYVSSHFFQPLQMRSSTYYQNADVKQRGASLYSDGVLQSYEYHLYRPDGALNSSAHDMANLLQFFIQKGQFGQQQILSPASLERMQHAQTTLGAAKGVQSGHGLASMTRSLGNTQVAFYGHAGRVTGGVVDVYYSPALQQGFAIMLSNDDYDTLDGIEELLQQFLLQNPLEKPAVTAIPAAFNHIDGWYRRINPRNEMTRYVDDLSGLTRFSINGNAVEQGGLLGGSAISGYFSGNTLTDAQTGLSSAAFVQDPLAGEVLQVRSNLYQRIATPVVYGILAIMVAWMFSALLNAIMVLLLVARQILGKTPAAPQLTLQILPFLATICWLLMKFAGDLLGDSSSDWGTVSATSLTVMISTVTYAALTIVCVGLSIRQWRQHGMRHWHATILSVLHACMLAYLWSYGVIGIRSWA